MLARALSGAAVAVIVTGCTLLYAPDEASSVGPGPVADAAVAREAGAPGVLPDAAADDAEAGGALHPYVRAVLDDAPVLYLRFTDPPPVSPSAAQVKDEVSGTTLGVRTNTTSATTGVLPGDGALALTGGWLVLGDRFGFAGRTPFTLELWLRADAAASRYEHVLTKQRRDQATKAGYALFFDETYLAFERHTAGEGRAVQAPFTVGTPLRHIACVYDGARLAIYADGNLEGETPDPRAIDVVPEPFVIGAPEVAATGQAFRGAIDELAVYDKALSVERISAHLAAAR